MDVQNDILDATVNVKNIKHNQKWKKKEKWR